MSSLVEELRALGGPAVHVRDAARVESLLGRLRAGGPDQLQLILDFDNTMTRVHRDGAPLDCSWGVMENSSLLPADYTSRCNAIRARYLPIEHDPHLEVAEKIPHMIKWYGEANALLKQCGVNRDMFPKMVRASNVEFRPGTEDMLRDLEARAVPVLILSAGLGDLLVEILNQHQLLTDNVKVVSNFLAFDADGYVAGIEGEMIHVFNKNENAVHDSDYFSKLQHRPNVVLMGDSMGDLDMANGVEDPEAVLKIGFLNSDVEKRLPKYMERYDIVLADDQTMRVPKKIVDKILEAKKE